MNDFVGNILQSKFLSVERCDKSMKVYDSCVATSVYTLYTQIFEKVIRQSMKRCAVWKISAFNATTSSPKQCSRAL